VGQRRDGQGHRRQRLDRGLQRELAGEFGARRQPQRRDDEKDAVTAPKIAAANHSSLVGECAYRVPMSVAEEKPAVDAIIAP
jgi:hypothetical protein